MSTAPSRPALVVPFTKMDGAGNDFVVLDNRFLRFSDDELAGLARQACARRSGVGADGLLALDEPDEEGAHFRMRYRNADGSLATMCGNGARCLARFAARAGLGDPTDHSGESDSGEGGAEDAVHDGGAVTVVFDTDGGRVRAEVPDARAASGPVTLSMPPPRDFAPTGLRDGPTPRSSRVFRIWTGTEHAVVFVPDVGREDVAATGGRLRWDGAFRPAGANVDFVQIVSDDHLVVRTYEKGVEGETLACGTGALAAALAAHLADPLARPDPDEASPRPSGRRRVAVDMPGGTLTVGFQLDEGEVSDLTLGGPARTAFEGTLEWRGGAEG